MKKLIITILATVVTLGILYAQQELVDLEGAVKVGDTQNSNPAAGTIRWNEDNQDFEGFNGTEWVSLTKQFEVSDEWQGTMLPPPPPTFMEDKSIYQTFSGTAMHWQGNSLVIGDWQHENWDGLVIDFEVLNDSLVNPDTVMSSNLAPGSTFGKELDRWGTQLIVAAEGNNIYGFNTGTAHIMNYSGGWSEVATLSPWDSLWHWATFGQKVAIDSAIAAVKCHTCNSISRIYMYEKIGASWLPDTILELTSIPFWNFTTAHMDIQGNTMIVALPGAEVNSIESHGKVMVFEKISGNWTLKQEIIPDDPGLQREYMQFGNGGALLQGDLLFIGSTYANTYSEYGGLLHIYKNIGGTWTHQKTLNPPVEYNSFLHGFGAHVAYDNGILIVSSDFMSNGIFVFYENAGNWDFVVRLVSGNDNPVFGIGIQGEKILAKINHAVLFYNNQMNN